MSEGLPPDSPQTIATLYADLAEREEALKNGPKPIITKDTLVPAGVIIGSLSTIAIVVWFAASLTFKVQAAEVRLDKVEEAISKLTDVQVQLSSITTNIQNIQDQLNKIPK